MISFHPLSYQKVCIIYRVSQIDIYTLFETLFLSNKMRQKYNLCRVLFLKHVQNVHLLPQYTHNNDVEQSDIPRPTPCSLKYHKGVKSGDRGENSVALTFRPINVDWMCAHIDKKVRWSPVLLEVNLIFILKETRNRDFQYFQVSLTRDDSLFKEVRHK